MPRNIRTLALAALATALLSLSGCGTSTTTNNPSADYQAKKAEIPNIVKAFSSPNLGVLLNSFQIDSLPPRILDAEALGTYRTLEKQAQKLMESYQIEPEKCRVPLMNTYQDDSAIPAAYSMPKSESDDSASVTVELRAFLSIKDAKKAISVQRELADTCPQFSAQNVKYQVKAQDYPVEGGTDGTLVATTVYPDDSPQAATVTVFQRVGNLELKAIFDGKDPQKRAEAASAEFKEALRLLGIALVTKS